MSRSAGSSAPALAESRLLRRLLERCRFPPPGTPLVCGVSGGADSLALLALASAAGCEVTALHVDHGLREGSEGDALTVRCAAERFGARCRCVAVEVRHGPNLEERAREARLAVLGDAATGHTADDQAETVLINLLRGAGADGLAGMRAGHRHPILALRRAETRLVCEELGLRPVMDPTNHDPAHLRNRVRRDLIPLMSALGGRDIVAVLARQAGLLAGDAELLAGLAAGVDPTDAAALCGAGPALARRAVRMWLAAGQRHPPGSAAVERVLRVARGQARAAEVGGGRRVRRSRGRLFIEGPGPASRGPSGR